MVRCCWQQYCAAMYGAIRNAADLWLELRVIVVTSRVALASCPSDREAIFERSSALLANLEAAVAGDPELTSEIAAARAVLREGCREGMRVDGPTPTTSEAVLRASLNPQGPRHQRLS